MLTLNSHNIITQASYISTFLDKLCKSRKRIRTIVRFELHFVLFQLCILTVFIIKRGNKHAEGPNLYRLFFSLHALFQFKNVSRLSC